MAEQIKFYVSEYGSYTLCADSAGRACVVFDDHEGGVHFEVAEFLRDTNIAEAKDALLAVIGHLVPLASTQHVI
jgi:hypothetical protein